MRYICYVIAVSFLFSACHSSKKTAATPVTPVPSAPIAALPVDTTKTETPLKREPYRATNTQLTDIIHTKLEVDFDWTACRMNGKATIEARPYFYPTNKLYIDAKGMDIKTVKVFEVATVHEKNKTNKKTEVLVDVWNDATKSSFIYENDSLKINLGRVFTPQQHYYVVIEYVAKPNELKKQGGSNAISDDKGLYFINPTGENPYKIPQIWTQGETQANSVWMPTVDSPNEKMTQDIYMTVEEKFITLSNGLLVEAKKNSNGTRTDHWKLDTPHSPYLAMMAVGEFKKVTDAPWNGKEISYYVEKDYEAHAPTIFGDTKEMIEFYSNKLGVPYAWPKYAQIVVRDYVSGAMENTSATLHGDFMVYQTTREMVDGKRGNLVIAHELFHQWFGDLVTCESWSNLSLNESFATYGEYLWEEYKFGRDAADEHHLQSRQGYMASQKEVDIIRFNYDDKEDMFDGFSYNKGGQVLHMLRKAVGDDAFFASLKNYLETNRNKSAEIHHLRLAFEETTGRDMNWFFNQWFLNKGRPKLKITSSYNVASGSVELTVEQNQDVKKFPLYTLPLDIDVYVNGKVEKTKCLITEQKQVLSIKTSGQPQLVNFDAERQLLADIDYKKTTEEYVFQYKNAPLFEDRKEALVQLESKIGEQVVYDLFKYAAQKDSYYGIRNLAIAKLEKAPEDKLSQTKACLMDIYKNDKKTTTRAEALGSLNSKFPGDADVMLLNTSGLNETSYAICGEALKGFIKNDPKLAMEKAKAFENESGKGILFPIANLYATHGGDEQLNFFHRALKYVSGFELLSFSSSYVKTAKRSTSSSMAIATAMDLEELSKGASKFIKFSLLKGMKDLASTWEALETGKKAKIEADKKENKDVTTLEKELITVTETKDILTKMYNRSK
jgi:aminopeptidase N